MGFGVWDYDKFWVAFILESEWGMAIMYKAEFNFFDKKRQENYSKIFGQTKRPFL